MLRKVAAIRKWPATTGTIVSSERAEGSFADADTNWVPVVRYSYQANDRTHTSDVVASTRLVSGGASFTEKVLAKYPAGSQVTVYYNPQEPEEAVLERSDPGVKAMYILFGVFDAILFAVILPLVLVFG